LMHGKMPWVSCNKNSTRAWNHLCDHQQRLLDLLGLRRGLSLCTSWTWLLWLQLGGWSADPEVGDLGFLGTVLLVDFGIVATEQVAVCVDMEVSYGFLSHRATPVHPH
jgi:hypothetical protein